MTVPIPTHSPRFQTGAALIVSMVMLLVVTAIGVAVMGSSHLELLMSNNSHLQTDAYRNAEIAINEGLKITNLPVAINTLAPNPNDITTWDNSTFGTPVTSPSGTVIGRYAVEYLSHDVYTIAGINFLDTTSPCPPGGLNFCLDIYRAWAIGTDGKGATRLLQETYTVVTGYDVIPSWRNFVEIK